MTDKEALSAMLQQMTVAEFEALMIDEVRRHADRLTPDEALRFLFRLDAALYPLQGYKSIEYDGGVHTKHRHIRYHDFFVDRITPGSHVLDIGCGKGELAYDIAVRSKAHVVGIDINEQSLAFARERHTHPQVEYFLGDVLRDLPVGTYDFVILSNVLEHLPHRVEFLRELKQVAQPKKVLIRVPLFEREWRVPLKKELGVEWRLDPTHETEYTQESFIEEVEAAGYTIIDQEIRWSEIWAQLRIKP